MEYKKLLDDMENKPGFFKHNNYHVEKATEEECIIRADLTENSMNPYGIAHGGFIFGLGDVVMGMLARSTGRAAVTLNASINYLKPGTGKYLLATAEMIKNGKTTCVLRANIYNDKEELVATMDSNYYYIG
ncbi:MAG: PaaI family thioesterase [Bacilli bacterium]|nr:PaaI family thioesterase [Bacilli bacterium]